MLLKEPYFMKNREWYWIDENSNDVAEYKLTDKAPEKAKESYKEFYSVGAFSGYPPYDWWRNWSRHSGIQKTCGWRQVAPTRLNRYTHKKTGWKAHF